MFLSVGHGLDGYGGVVNQGLERGGRGVPVVLLAELARAGTFGVNHSRLGKRLLCSVAPVALKFLQGLRLDFGEDIREHF